MLKWLKGQIDANSGIAEEWHEGADFYVKLKSGLIVQGGSARSTDLANGSYVTLHEEFSSADYLVLLTPFAFEGVFWRGNPPTANPTARGTFAWGSYGGTGTGQIMWLAIGY